MDCPFKRHWKNDNPLSLCLSSSRSYPRLFLSTLPLLSSAFPQFGDSQQLRLVRILRSTVMVRVGGGWMALDEFLVKNDPCRGKSDINAGGNLLFRDRKNLEPLGTWQRRFQEVLNTDRHSIIHISTQYFYHLSHHLSRHSFQWVFSSFFSTIRVHSHLIFHYLPITSWPLSHGGCFYMHGLHIWPFLSFSLSFSFILFCAIVVHGACSLGLSLPLSLPRPLSLFLSPQCNIQDLKSSALTPAAPYHLA